MELPILLAAFGPMRRGEICALDTADISGNIVHVRKNMIRTPENTWIIHQPKSYAGDRYIDFPDFVSAKWKGKQAESSILHQIISLTGFHGFSGPSGCRIFVFTI